MGFYEGLYPTLSVGTSFIGIRLRLNADPIDSGKKSKFCQNGPGGVQKVEKSQSPKENFSWEHFFSSTAYIRLPKNHIGVE